MLSNFFLDEHHLQWSECQFHQYQRRLCLDTMWLLLGLDGGKVWTHHQHGSDPGGEYQLGLVPQVSSSLYRIFQCKDRLFLSLIVLQETAILREWNSFSWKRERHCSDGRHSSKRLSQWRWTGLQYGVYENDQLIDQVSQVVVDACLAGKTNIFASQDGQMIFHPFFL